MEKVKPQKSFGGFTKSRMIFKIVRKEFRKHIFWLNNHEIS
jgi:hypothetical protein